MKKIAILLIVLTLASCATPKQTHTLNRNGNRFENCWK